MMRKALSLTLALIASTAIMPMHAIAQEDEKNCQVGEIKWFAMDWVPRGFVKAEGQIMSIQL